MKDPVKAFTVQKPAPKAAGKEQLRRQARDHIENGAVTENYQGDLKAVLNRLNDALATETICALRYKRHYFMAKGIHAQAVAAEFLEHAAEEQTHADRIAERIAQLGGAPDLNPATMAERSHSEYIEGTSMMDMIQEDLVAERIAIDSYSAFVRDLGGNDPTTRRMLEEILAVEEKHADEMKKLLENIPA